MANSGGNGWGAPPPGNEGWGAPPPYQATPQQPPPYQPTPYQPAPAQPPGASAQPQGRGWWQAGDGWYYPPESHPMYGKLPVPGSGITMIKVERSRKPLYIGLGVAAVLAVAVLGVLTINSVSNQARKATSDRVDTARERAAENQRRIDEAMAELGAGPGAEQDSIGETGDVALESGEALVDDAFADPDSGWPTGATAQGNSTAYVDGGYDLVAATDVGLRARAPYVEVREQISVAATMSMGPAGTPGRSGIRCERTNNASTVSYDLFADADGGWHLEQREAYDGDATTPSAIAVGTLPAGAPATPVTLRLVCATQPDSWDTRVLAYVGDELVADELDDSGELVGDGWLGAIVASGVGTTTHVSWFEERDFNP